MGKATAASLLIMLVSSISAQAAKPPKIYYADYFIHRANPDGSSVEQVTSTAGDSAGIDLDLAGGNVYWTTSNSSGDSGIYRSDLDGGNVVNLLTVPRFTTGLALDPSHGKMYWTNWNGKTIQRSNLGGDNVETLIDTGLYGPIGIAVDPDGGKMYWADNLTAPGGGCIRRANLDGSDIEDIVTGLFYPLGIDLDLPAGKVYWTDVSSAKIQRANLDGSSVENLITAGLIWPNSIDLDVSGGKMYWTDGYSNAPTHKIQRADLDGSNVEDLITEGLGYPNDIAFAIPEPATLSLLALGGLAMVRRRRFDAAHRKRSYGA
ncbi:MAG: PEP-CTERM sorting domain-containing protein [Phycisphaerae bacterium]|nr:PEP-CTERM sorting domain-containing protein [Phycisphaerae bacterium]